MFVCKLVGNCLHQQRTVSTTNHRNQRTALAITNYTALEKLPSIQDRGQTDHFTILATIDIGPRFLIPSELWS